MQISGALSDPLTSVAQAFDRALRLHQAGLIPQARECYEAVLRQESQHAESLHLLGVCYHQLGQPNSAAEWILKAIEVDGQQPVYFNNLGVTYLALARYDEALASFSKAISLAPDYADALSNYGTLLFQRNLISEAEHSFRRALIQQPAHSEALRGLAKLLTARGERSEAIQLWRQIDKASPSFQAKVELANLLMLDMQPQEAIAEYQSALALRPETPTLRMNLARALAETGELEDAAAQVTRACDESPDEKAWPLAKIVHCPIAFPSVGAIDEYRHRLSTRLDGLIEDPHPVDIQDAVNVGFFPPFALSFQGRAHRPLKEKFATVFRNWIKPLDVSPKPGTPRVGFVVTRGHEGAFARCMAGIIDQLGDNVIPVVLCSQASESYLRTQIRSQRVEMKTFSDLVASAVETIAAAQCHVLYYWEIGSDGLNYVLPFYRLAPVQVTSWGTQVTSGLREVDFYLSSALIENDDAQTHYTERLRCFDSLPTFQHRHARPSQVSRSQLGLPDDRTIYLCPQTILKLHPEQDEAFAQILKRDPNGVLVLKEGHYRRPNEILKARLKGAMGRAFERVIFLPHLSHADYLRLLTKADVVLDTHYFSAGTTAYDFFSFARPVVTWPGDWNIGRFTLGCYRKMEYVDLVASTQDRYVELAVQLGRDRAYRESVEETLNAKTDLLFADESAVAEHADFFLNAACGAIRSLAD